MNLQSLPLISRIRRYRAYIAGTLLIVCGTGLAMFCATISHDSVSATLTNAPAPLHSLQPIAKNVTLSAVGETQGTRISLMIEELGLNNSGSIYGVTTITCGSVVAQVQNLQGWGYYVDFYRVGSRSFACGDCAGGRCMEELRLRFNRKDGYAVDLQADFTAHWNPDPNGCIPPPEWGPYLKTFEEFSQEAEYSLNALENELQKRKRN